MKRCIFEYTTNNKKSIKTDDGKEYIEDIFTAKKIEQKIKEMILESKCKINNKQYSQNLIDAINRMYEVILIFIIQGRKIYQIL